MSVATIINRVSYGGNGVTTNFAFNYRALAAADFLVIEKDDATGVETTKSLTTHYTVSGSGSTWTITMLTAPASGKTLTIINDPAATQGIDLVENDSFPAETAEGGFDRAMLVSQRIKDLVQRSVRLTDGYSASFTPTLPALLTASQVLGINAAGDGFQLYDFGSLGAIGLPAGNGLAVYTGSNTFTNRTLTAGAGITVTNGDGQSGNPTVAITDAGVTGAAGGGKLAYSAVNGQTADTAPALNDEVLTGDTSATALKKTTLAEIIQLGRNFNYAQNAEFRFWQRQVPGTLTARADDAYGPDRWYSLTESGNTNVARVAEVIASSPTPFVAQIRQADATARRFGIAQILESSRVLALRGKQVTFAFWARTDGTEVPNIRAGIVEWTGTADSVTSDIVSSWAATPTLIANAAFVNTPADLALSGTMQQFTITVTLGSTFNNLILFIWAPAQEAQNDDFYVTQVQLVEHSEALPWTMIQLPFEQDLIECQRFYEKSYDLEALPGVAGDNNGITVIVPARTFTANQFTDRYRVTKRAVPTPVIYSNTATTINNVRDTSGATNVAASPTLVGINGHGVSFAASDGSSTLWHWTADAEL